MQQKNNRIQDGDYYLALLNGFTSAKYILRDNGIWEITLFSIEELPYKCKHQIPWQQTPLNVGYRMVIYNMIIYNI